MIETKVYEDQRGYFMETYRQDAFAAADLPISFVQDNQSRSSKGVLRGLHFQRNYPQAKLVRVLAGKIFDVAVDLRKNSNTYGQWVGEVLSAQNKKQLFIPHGFAHGFLVISEFAEVLYKCDDVYRPMDEGGINWNDPMIGIEWPDVGAFILSEKDKQFPYLNETKIEL